MKHNVGDLVAMEDIKNWTNPVFRLGYIQSIEVGVCLVYFFDYENSVWYSENQIDVFKDNLNHLNRYDGKREIDWKPGKRVKQ